VKKKKDQQKILTVPKAMRFSLALRGMLNDHFFEDLHRVSAKYWATHKIGSKSKSSRSSSLHLRFKRLNILF